MEQSILKSTKQALNVNPDDPAFDLVIITHINSAFSNLNDVGVGFEGGYVIEDDTPEWTDFLADETVMLSKIRTYVFLYVKLLFDPPTVSYLLDSAQKQLEEQIWRISVNREGKFYTDPEATPDDAADDIYEIDGGMLA